nr:MAG TPA: hypothetical protein [Caudoviricetes sp.]
MVSFQKFERTANRKRFLKINNSPTKKKVLAPDS